MSVIPRLDGHPKEPVNPGLGLIGEAQMSYTRRAMVLGTAAAALTLPLLKPTSAVAAASTDIDHRANAALHELYRNNVLALP